MELCSNPEVMEHFPSTLNDEETKHFLQRLIDHHEKYGYSYFACELKDTGAIIGFIGLAYQTYDSPCTPAVDIGWRLLPSAWGKGYATEGAKACLEFAFQTLNLDEVVSVCTTTNIGSEKVMQRIGMTKRGSFEHPKLKDYPELQACLWYAAARSGESSDLVMGRI